MPWRWAVVVAVLAVAGGTLAVRGAAGGAPAGPLTAAELARLTTLAGEATVEVSAVGCGGVTVGSGFGVAGQVVTNRHIVAGAAEAKVQRATGPARVPVLGPHPVLDLALLRGVGGPDLDLAPGRPPVGEPVVLAGRPGGGPVVVTPSAVHLYSDGAPWGMPGEVLLLDTPTGGGWSGGPVLDRRGRVVGVLAAEDRATGLAIAIPVDDVRRWLEDPSAPVPIGCGRGSA